MPLSGRSAALRVTGLNGVASTNEATTRSTGVGASTSVTGYVQINTTSRRHLDPNGTHTLWRIAAGSTTLVSSTEYTLNMIQGIFQWNTGDPSTGTYQADIEYLTATSVAGGREWQLQVESEAFEVTEFGSSGWRQFQPNLSGATVTIQRYWNDPTFLDNLASTGDNRFVIELVVNSANGWKYEGFARVASVQPQTAVDAIVGESVNFVIDGQLYFTT